MTPSCPHTHSPHSLFPVCKMRRELKVSGWFLPCPLYHMTQWGGRQWVSKQSEGQPPPRALLRGPLPPTPTVHEEARRALNQERASQQSLKEQGLSQQGKEKAERTCCNSCLITRMKKGSCTEAGGTQVRFGRTSLMA